jgi:hypothetical protein
VSTSLGGSMAFSGPARVAVHAVNSAMTWLTHTPLLGRLLGRYITEISYTGRNSGKSFTLPVGYQLRGDTVTIRVGMPDKKNWWRNFLGTGAPLTIRLDGGQRRGHAVATRDQTGRVSVVATLEP